MEIKKMDKWFILMASMLFIIIIFDMAVTLYGVNLGFTEGNPIIRYFFKEIGIKTTAIGYFFLTIIFFFGLIYVREKIFTSEKEARFLYTVIGILMSYRAFIVGTWFGLLTYKISGVV